MAQSYSSFSRLLLVSGLAALAVPALAQPGGGCGPMEGGWGGFREHRDERMQQHQKALHDALKLSPEQEGAWKKFSESMQPPAKAERGKPEEGAKLTMPERAEKMLELAKQRQERMGEHLAALKTFYATLTPEQKKTFDEFHTGPRGGRRAPPAGANPAAPGKG